MLTKILFVLILIICIISAAVARPQNQAVRGTKCISIENNQAGYYFNTATLDLVDIRDKRQGISYIQEPGQGVFSVGVPFASQASYLTDQPRLISSKSAGKKLAELLATSSGSKLILHYDGCELNENGSSMNVTVTLTLAKNESVAKWNLKIDSTQPVMLGETHFPIISGIGTSVKNKHEKEYIAVPYYGGTKRDNPRANLVCNQGWTNYPGGGMTLQLLTYCDGIGKGSLYLSSYDAEGYRKTFTCEPRLSGKAFSWYIMHYPELSDAVSSWSMPYSIACGPIQGDWYNSAKLYREWALSNPQWKPLTKSTDPYSKWFRDTMVWNSGIYGLPNCSPEWFRKFNNILGQTSAYHWYSWWKDARFDHDYPNYFPADPAFKETIQKTKLVGLRSIPYMNMHLFETQLPIWKELKAEDWVCRDVKGEMVHYFWDIPTSNPKYPGEVKRMVQMCRGSKGWQDYAVSMYKKVVDDYDVDGIYLDELVNYPNLCYAKNHDYASYGGTYHAKGTRLIAQRIRAETGKKDLAIFGENLSEYYIGAVDGFLSGHSDVYDYENGLPIFQSVYKDCSIEMGVFMMPDESKRMTTFAGKLGYNLVRGRQLGWFGRHDVDMLDPACEQQLGFLKKLAEFRLANLDLLMYGEFLRPIDKSALPTHQDDWFSFLSGKSEKTTVPDVFSQPYRAANGDFGMVLVNVTDKETSISIPVSSKDWGLKVGGAYNRSEYKNGAWGTASPVKLGSTLDVSIPAYEAAVVRLHK
jgi:hypothetical protein